MMVLLVLSRQLGGYICFSGVIYSNSTVMMCYRIYSDSYVGVICPKSTVMVLLSVLSRQLWW